MSSKHVVFHNPGLVNITAITTFGVNAKETDNPIGFFGTGFKYAIAVILRNGGTISLYRGRQLFVFTTESRVIRDKSFDLVMLEEHDPHDPSSSPQRTQLGFTTDLGKNWEPWMAFRELYCNAKDEGGGISPKLKHDDNTTSIVVKWDEFVNVYHERSQYFLEPEPQPLFHTPHGEVYAGQREHIFYKGVRVLKLNPIKSGFTYNITAPMQLTEDRTVSTWDALRTITAIWGEQCNNKQCLEEALTANSSTLEAALDFQPAYVPVSDFFLDTVEQLHLSTGKNLNMSAVNRLLRERAPKDPTPIELDDLDCQRLAKAIGFCKRLGYPVDDYPISVLETLGTGTLAMADTKNKRIYLCRQLFNQGTKLVAQALIEEFIHIRHNLHDETRALQTYLFETVISLGERVLGEAL
jgi:hypothetical protein